jgi:hypothetical protein
MIVFILLIILIIYLLYKNKYIEFYSNFRSINYNQYFKRNRDLDYVSNRFNLNIPFSDNIKTNQIAPILNCQNNDLSLWGVAPMAEDYNLVTNRIPDKYSNSELYNNNYVHKL